MRAGALTLGCVVLLVEEPAPEINPSEIIDKMRVAKNICLVFLVVLDKALSGELFDQYPI